MSRSSASGDAFEALADENRREILRLLSAGDKPVAELAAGLPISRPAVSRHLRLLKDAGLVSDHAQGTHRIYHLEGQGMSAIQEFVDVVWGEAATRRLVRTASGLPGAFRDVPPALARGAWARRADP